MKVSVCNLSGCNVDRVISVLDKDRQRDPCLSSGNIIPVGVTAAPVAAVSDDLFPDRCRDLPDDVCRRTGNVITLNEVDPEIDDSLYFFRGLDAFCKRQNIIVVSELDEILYEVLLLRRSGIYRRRLLTLE